MEHRKYKERAGTPVAPIFLTDDAAARLAGERMGVEVHGTLGVLIRAARRGRRTPVQVLKTLEEMPARSTLYLEKALLDQVLLRFKEAHGL